MTLDLLTWNLDGLEPRDLDQRTEAMCLEVLMQPQHPHVVLFQEVVSRSLLAHIKPHFGHAGFRFFPEPPPDREYFCLIGVRAPWQVVSWNRTPFAGSVMGRGLVEARLRQGETEILVMTGHLESLRDHHKERVNQLGHIVDRLLDTDVPAVFGGDTNLRDEEALVPARGEYIEDVWEILGRPRQARYTWDPKTNANINAKGVAKSGRRMRFDRVLLSPKQWRPDNMVLLGTQGVLPSDHYGVRTRLTLL